jgi:hypothetical protein
MEITNEATYNFGKEEYTKKNLTPTEILDLAYAYKNAKTMDLIGKKIDIRIRTSNDLARLTGGTQLDAKQKSGKPALILFLLKNELISKDEYIQLYRDLVKKHKSVISALKNASPESRNIGGAARVAAKDMKGEFGESVNEEKVYIDFLNKKKGFKQDRIKFTSYEAAVKWAKKNFDNFNSDMIKYESVNEASIDVDVYRKKQAFVIGPKFAEVASDSDVELMARLKRVNSEHEWQLKQNIKSMDHLYKKYKLRSKKGIEESVNEASMSDIDIIAQEAKDFKDFVKEFYTEFKDFPKTKDSLKWLEDVYKGRTKMEGLDKDGMERVASGLPQTKEKN